MSNCVYLVPLSNGTYVPYVEETAPSDKAILLTREGNYPVSLVEQWLDPYGCGGPHERTIHNRSELLQSLLVDGQMCTVLMKLWDYDIHGDFSDDIGDLFDLAYYTRMVASRGNGNVNAAYDFARFVTLDEYCSWCVFMKQIGKRPLSEDFECTKPDNQTDDLPF